MRAIESVLNQTYKNVQLIVVDDGSSDNTPELLSGMSEIEYCYQSHVGQGAARNKGLKMAKGKYIATLDSDDVWLPSFLEQQIKRIEMYDLDFTFANWHQQTDKSTWYDCLKSRPATKPFQHEVDQDNWVHLDYATIRGMFTQGCICPSSGIVFSRDCFPESWNEDMNIADDWFLMLEIVLNKKVNTAFTFDILWEKNVQYDNLYDGRGAYSLNRLLYYEDFAKILNHFGHIMSRDEKNYFLTRHYSGMFHLSYHHMFRAKVKNPFKGVFYLTEAFVKNPIRAFSFIKNRLPDLLYNTKSSSYAQKSVNID